MLSIWGPPKNTRKRDEKKIKMQKIVIGNTKNTVTRTEKEIRNGMPPETEKSENGLGPRIEADAVQRRKVEAKPTRVPESPESRKKRLSLDMRRAHPQVNKAR